MPCVASRRVRALNHRPATDNFPGRRPVVLSFDSMPTYEFRCKSGHLFEQFYRSMNAAPSELACPDCGEPAERLISGGAGLVFKGSGFYITDYGKDGKKAQSSGGEAKKADAGGESKKSDAASGSSGGTAGGSSGSGTSGSPGAGGSSSSGGGTSGGTKGSGGAGAA